MADDIILSYSDIYAGYNANTVRLYLNNNTNITSSTANSLGKPLIIAPIPQYSFTASNTYGEAKSLGLAVAEGLLEADQSAHDFVQDIMTSIEKWINGEKMDPAKYTDLFGKKNLTLSDFNKAWNSGEMSLPINQLTCTYLSDNPNSGILSNLYGNKSETHPLIDYANALMDVLAPTIEQNTGTVTDYWIMKAPSKFMFNASDTNYHSESMSHGFLTMFIGTKIIINNLLPTKVSVTPSKYRTPKGDYYAMTVSIAVQSGCVRGYNKSEIA